MTDLPLPLERCRKEDRQPHWLARRFAVLLVLAVWLGPTAAAVAHAFWWFFADAALLPGEMSHLGRVLMVIVWPIVVALPALSVIDVLLVSE